jgi:hypothetical protein
VLIDSLQILKIDPRLQRIDPIDSGVVVVIGSFRTQPYFVRPLFREDAVGRRFYEIDVSNQEKTRDNEPTLLQIQAMKPYCPTIVVPLKLNRAAPQLK